MKLKKTFLKMKKSNRKEKIEQNLNRKRTYLAEDSLQPLSMLT